MVMFFSLDLGWLPSSGQISLLYDVPSITGIAIVAVLMSQEPWREEALHARKLSEAERLRGFKGGLSQHERLADRLRGFFTGERAKFKPNTTVAQWLEADGVDVAQLPRVIEHRSRVAERAATRRAIAMELEGVPA